MNTKLWLTTEEKIPIVHRIMLEAFEEYRFLDVPSSALNESIERLQTVFNSGIEQALLCSVDGVPLGSSRFTKKVDFLCFSSVSVTPIARGKGVAKAMLLWLETYAKENRIM